VVISEDRPQRETAHFSGHAARLLLPQRRLEMLYELSERLTRLQYQNELLEDVINICFETLHFERGAIAIRNADGRGVQWPVVRNLRGAGGELTISRSVLSRALDHGERAVFHDAGDASFDPTVSMVQHGIRSAMCVPLRHEQEILGVIYGDRLTASKAYSQEDLDFLAGLARQVSIGLINARLMAEQAANVRLENEISLARSIQQRLFPSELPDREDIAIEVLNDPGRHVSGDYYDVIELSDGRVAFLVADVTGEGVAAALLMANLQAAVRVTLATSSDIASLLKQWNDLLYSNTDASKFVTCLVGILDPARRELVLGNAGHLLPYVIVPSSAKCEVIEMEGGFPLGVVDDAEYEAHSVSLGAEPCLLYCYTDGVIEAMDPEGELFSTERLHEALRATDQLNPAKLIHRLRKEVSVFRRGAPPSDDITMMAIRVG
jgi:sigma-B regulation protein RsbU (phosphoserine phosphatase)